MAKYKIKNVTLLHNGKTKKPGDVIELTDAQAKKLGTYVEPVEEIEKDKNPATKTSKGTKTKKEETTPDEDKKDGTENKGENN